MSTNGSAGASGAGTGTASGSNNAASAGGDSSQQASVQSAQTGNEAASSQEAASTEQSIAAKTGAVNAPEQAVENTGEEQQEAPVSFSDYTKKHLSELYGEDYGDEDSLKKGFDKFVSDHKDIKEKHTKNMDTSKKISEMINADPNFASVMSDLMKGESFPVSLAKHYDVSTLGLKEGDEGYQDYAKAHETYRQKQSEYKQKQEAREKNRAEAETIATKFAEQTFGDDSESSDKFFGWLDATIKGVLEGKISEEMLTKMHQGFIYETAVQEAVNDGRIAGRNEQIVNKTQTEAKKKQGDGMPVIGGADAEKVSTPLDNVLSSLSSGNQNERI